MFLWKCGLKQRQFSLHRGFIFPTLYFIQLLNFYIFKVRPHREEVHATARESVFYRLCLIKLPCDALIRM